MGQDRGPKRVRSFFNSFEEDEINDVFQRVDAYIDNIVGFHNHKIVWADIKTKGRPTCRCDNGR